MKKQIGLCALLGLIVLNACASEPHPDVLAALAGEMTLQYHACVPLGWEPVDVHGTFYPGYTASLPSYEEFIDAMWRGRILDSDLRRRDARNVRAVLDHLAAAGLVTEKRSGAGFDYFLTSASFPYFYGNSRYQNNRDSLTYLCYSTIVPQHIAAMKAIAAPPGRQRRKTSWFDVTFDWHAGPPAGWANDPFLQQHSVVLPPVSSPTSATVYRSDGTWYVARITNRDWMLPAFVDASAWN